MILALDLGTSTVKAGLFSPAGRCLRSGSAAIAMRVDPDPLIHEIPALAWVEAVRDLCAALLREGGRPDCVVVSGNGPTLLPADAEGRPLHDAITWMDRRAVEEAAAASAALGRFVDPAFYLPKALWFFRKRPDIYERTASFFSCPEYLVRVLTGESRTVLPAPGFEKFIWDPSSIEALGMDAAKFPPFVGPGTVVGVSSREAERLVGLPAGLPVVPAGPDFVASLVGTATTKPGRACDRAGTSEGINLCAALGVDDPRVLSLPHVIQPFANISGVISTSGKAVDWFKRVTGRADGDYESFFEDICDCPPGASKLVFLPYLSGERSPIWDPLARGAFVGMTLGHGRKEMSRAVVESTAFAIRDVVEAMESLDAPVAELRVTGNPGRSPVWNQIKADIVGRPIVLPEFEYAELLGDACMGLVAMGRYGGFAEAAEDLVRIGRTFLPEESTRSLYDELFGVYRGAYEALKPVFKRLDGIQTARSPQ